MSWRMKLKAEPFQACWSCRHVVLSHHWRSSDTEGRPSTVNEETADTTSWRMDNWGSAPPENAATGSTRINKDFISDINHLFFMLYTYICFFNTTLHVNKPDCLTVDHILRPDCMNYIHDFFFFFLSADASWFIFYLTQWHPYFWAKNIYKCIL